MWGKIKRVEEDSNIAVVEKKRKDDMIKREQNIVLKIGKRW